MPSNMVGQMIRQHEEFIGATYAVAGSRPFTMAEIRRHGVEEPKGCTIQKLRARGVVMLAQRLPRERRVWRLSQQVAEHFEAQEVSA